MDITQNRHTESVVLRIGFYAFATEYIFMSLSTTKPEKSVTELDLEKHTALHPLL